MGVPSGSDGQIRTERRQSLAKLLEQNERIKVWLEECVEELSLVNAILKRAVSTKSELQCEVMAMEKNELAEKKVREAIGQLNLVNHALAFEERGRRMVDHQLAAAIEQGNAARNEAFHDSLTGLPNRALFNDRLEEAFVEAQRRGWMLAVMFVDLDGFKIVNDSYGHQAGDAVLETIAQRLKAITRMEDTVSRHGGDEFLYLLTGIRDGKDIAMVTEKIRHAIQVPFEVNVDSRQVLLSIKVTIGVAIYPEDGATADSLINHADAAMYRGKKARS